jgi:hypothetical protein
MQDLAMQPHERQEEVEEIKEEEEEGAAPCSLLDLVAFGPVQELIWSGLDSKDRHRLRETCRGLRDEVEQSCTTLRLFNRTREDEAESLVKLSGRLPQVRTLHLNSTEAVRAFSLDPPPAGEQHLCAWCAWNHQRPLTFPSPPSQCGCPPSLPAFRCGPWL